MKSKQKETKKLENQNPSNQVLDCSKNKKLVTTRGMGYVFLTTQDAKKDCEGAIALRLKSPFAKNFAKLVEAFQTINKCTVEQLEIKGGE